MGVGALLYGGRLLVPDSDLTKDFIGFSQWCDQQGVTVLNQTPGAFYAFTDAAVSQQLPLTALRYVIFGGDKQTGSVNPGERITTTTQLVNMYGITETTVHVTYEALITSTI